MREVEFTFTTMDKDQLPEGEWYKAADGDHCMLFWRPKEWKEPDSGVPGKPRQEEDWLDQITRSADQSPFGDAEYCISVMRWIMTETDVEELRARWHREKTTRNRLNVSCEARAMLETEMKARARKLQSFPHNEVETYCGWFREHYSREPASLFELAQFLDDERNRGQFANNPAVNGMYGMSSDPDAMAVFDRRLQAQRHKENDSLKF